MPAIDLRMAHEEFQHLKRKEQARNYEYYLARQAVQGNFRWPRDWPKHIPKLKDNLCKRIVERYTAYLMGKGFTFNVERPNTLEYRDAAERAEKILTRIFELSKAELHLDQGARNGSQLGRTIFKVYKRGPKGAQHACFTNCQPDYFYGVSSGDDALGDFSTVYYSYPLDILEARRMFGARPYSSEAQMDRDKHYEPTADAIALTGKDKERRIPVLEVWNKDSYALSVGGQVIYNGDTPPEYRWSQTGDGFIPFIVIDNVRTGVDGVAAVESDIGQVRELNEELNQLLSRKQYLVKRYLQPTLVWEGAPQNYAEILANTIGGGGAIPARIGSKLYFLAYDRPMQAVIEMEQTLRLAITETSGMNPQALNGDLDGSINTGPSVETQFAPVLSSVESKQNKWKNGLSDLCAMLLNVQEAIGDSKALGEAVIGQEIKSKNESDGELVALSGKDIEGLRTVTISWPGILPKDNLNAAQLEISKAQQGFQSIYTTLEKLGEQYPDDEIARIRMENQDPNLRGEKVAEQMRAQAPLLNAAIKQQQVDQQAAQTQQDAAPQDYSTPSEEDLLAQGDIGARLREMQRRKPSLNTAGDEPTVESGPLY